MQGTLVMIPGFPISVALPVEDGLEVWLHARPKSGAFHATESDEVPSLEALSKKVKLVTAVV